MFKSLIPMAIAPILICCFYIYIRDKYEKEPVRLLLVGVIFGAVISMVIVNTELFLSNIMPQNKSYLFTAFYDSFVVAAFVEEFFKFLVLYLLVWRDRNFNERFDAIVYAVFISLGFALVENILYVTNAELGGGQTALMRALISVPAHALFAVTMGYYFALSKFEHHNRRKLWCMAFVVPFIIHGIYDFILKSNYQYYMIIFIIFLVYLWYNCFKKMKEHISKSPFKFSEKSN